MKKPIIQRKSIPFQLCYDLKMKLTTFLLIVSLFQIQANPSYGQNTKITLDLQNVSLEKVLNRIETLTDYKFVYMDKEVNYRKTITINVSKKSISEVLENLFSNTNIEYRIYRKQIILRVKETSQSSIPLNGKIIEEPQQFKISGTVIDTNRSPLPGASIVEKGTLNGVTTDFDGNFTIALSNDQVILSISYIGFSTKEVPVNGQQQLQIILQEDSSELDEVVVVGYGTQKKADLTGAISDVKGEALSSAPIANITNTLSGRLPGLVSLQSSGQPGFDDATLSIRGFGDPLVIVDGVEGDFNSLDPNQIESISILKDGSASIYGSRAGNGVMLVTTKRGKLEKPTITFNSSYTLQGVTTMPTPVSAGQYAELTSEAYLQSGQSVDNVPYTPEQIEKYYAGTDPQFPNTDWADVLIRDWAPQSQYDLSIRGGSEKIKYYGFIGYLDQQTLWKKSGGKYNRYNLLSNVDAKISESFSIQMNIGSTVKSRMYPPRMATGNSILYRGWEDYWRTAPTYPATLPDPSKNSFADGGGTGGAQMTTNADISGYAITEDQNLRGTMILNYSSQTIKGLSAKALINYTQDYITSTIFTKPYEYYTYDYNANIYSLKGALGSDATMSVQDNKSRVITGQLSLNYDKVFANDHHIKLLALYESIDYKSDFLYAYRQDYLTDAIDQLYAGGLSGQSNNGSATIMGRSSYVGRLNYSYKNKYLLESSIRADASAKFSPQERWGYFPSILLAWRMSNEDFMSNSEHLDELKFRASYGSSGNDGVGNFQYLEGYQISSSPFTGISYLFGDGGPQPSLISKGLANPGLTWEKMKIYNFGIDFSLWQRKLYGTGEVFYRDRSGIPATSINTLPGTFGASLPPENLNSINNRGFEFNIGTSGNSGEFYWDIGGNVSWSRAKWEDYDEPDYTDPDQKRIEKKTGQWTDTSFGYLTDGLFTSQPEIDNLNFNQDNNFDDPNSSLRTGDVKYIDGNGDGILDWKDKVNIGKGTVPHWIVGFNANLRYKNFDLSALFQGAMGYYTHLNLFPGSVYTTVVYNNRWTPENNDPHALVPRLGGAGIQFSDYNYKKAGYLRLKSFSFGYNFPFDLIKQMKLSQLRLYLAGTNLLTFDKLSKYDIDPEAPSGNGGNYYPQQKTISYGISVSF